jgi:hypothetical protein
MIKSIIDVDGYWSIVLFVDVDYNKFSIIESALTDILAPISIINKIYNKIGNKLNAGVTFSNHEFRTSVVCINKTTSREELINTISHEADHVQDAICKYYDVPLESEDAAYLIGYLVSEMYYNSRRLFCSY